MIPQTNATLTSIDRGGTSEDYDTGTGADSNAWLGISRCYVGVRTATIVEGNLLNRTKITYALVEGELGPFSPGDTLTIDGKVHTVRDIRDRQVDILPPQPIRLDFETE